MSMLMKSKSKVTRLFGVTVIFIQAVTSMDMAPRGEFLAVSMLDEPGLFIWSNRSLYMHVSLKGMTTYTCLDAF